MLHDVTDNIRILQITHTKQEVLSKQAQISCSQSIHVQSSTIMRCHEVQLIGHPPNPPLGRSLKCTEAIKLSIDR